MYVSLRWGHDECPSTAQLMYSRKAGGASPGSGSNPQCLPMDPQFPTPVANRGHDHRAIIQGAEYETWTYSNSHVHGHHDL